MGKMSISEPVPNGQRGITLIALVITIIVLLILAAVSIATLTGENGIVTQAGNAAEETRGAEVEERVNLWKSEIKSAEYTNASVKTDEELLEEMKTAGILFEEEIDREGQTIKIGDRIIDYTANVELTDIYVALYNDGTLVFNNKNDFDTTKLAEGWVIENIKGKHYGFYTDDGVPPWNDYADQIRKVEFAGKIVPEYTSMWFMNMHNLTSLDLSRLNTSKVTDMSAMFSGVGLTEINLINFDTSQVTDMNSMFSDNLLTSLDLSSFDTSNVTTMEYMFNRCENLSAINLKSFNTSKVERMNGMFSDCKNLTSLDLSNFDTSNVKLMTEMFYGCSKLTSLNLSNFNTSKVTSMRTMFYNCAQLKTITVGSKWTTDNVNDSDNMFGNCTALVGGLGTVYDANYTDKTYAHIDGGTENPGYLTASGS